MSLDDRGEHRVLSKVETIATVMESDGSMSILMQFIIQATLHKIKLTMDIPVPSNTIPWLSK